MKTNLKKLFDWKIKYVSGPMIRHFGNGEFAGYVVRVGYLHHGSRVARFYLPTYCDTICGVTPPQIAARQFYDKMCKKLAAQRAPALTK